MKHIFVRLILMMAVGLAAMAGGRAAAADFQSNSITAGGANVVFSRSATDASGNIYVTGWYQNTFSYGGLSAPVLAANLTNFFLLKTDPAGNGLLLTTAQSSTVSSVIATAVTTDSIGGVYIGMSCQNNTASSQTLMVGSTSFTINAGSANSIVAKFAQVNGTFVWAKADPNSASSLTGLIATADNASIIATGDFQGATSFGGTPLTTQPGVARNTFLIRINASTGVTTWVTEANNASGGYNRSGGIALDGSGNIYTAGYFGGVMFSGKPYQITANSTSLSNPSAYVVKWTNSPSASVAPVPQWALATTDTSNSFTSGNGLAVDVSSNVYVSFSLSRTDPTSTNVLGLNIYGTNNGTHYSQTNGGASEGSIVKFDSNGNILWGEGTLGAADSTNSNTRIAVTTNFVYSLGTFGPGAVTFGGVTTLGTPGDSFIEQLTTNGVLDFVARVNGSGATPSLLPLDLIASARSSRDVLDLVGMLGGASGTNSFIAQYGVGGPFTYTVNGGSNVTVTGYTGAGGVVTIPAEIIGLPPIGIGVSAFANNTAITSLAMPNGVLNIADAAFNNCSALTNVVLANSVTNIGNSSFAGCAALASVTGGTNVMSLGQSAFNGDAALSGFTLSSSLTSVGSFTFFNCTALQSITIPASLTQLGDYMFDNCSGITNLTLANTVANIGTYTFAFCSSLTSLTVPGSVTNLGGSAFYNCANLHQAYFQGNAPTVNGAAGSADSTVFAGETGTVFYLPNTTGWATTYGGWPTAGPFQAQPQILGAGQGFVQNNVFGFTTFWATNASVVVQVSTNLINWTPIITNALVNGTNVFTDSTWTNYPQRFYRVQTH